MKRLRFTMILFALIISLSLFGCANKILSDGNSNGVEYAKIEDIDKLNTYDIKVDLNTEDMTYAGSESITYLNKSEDELESIYFHLYPNAFKTLEDAPILFGGKQSIKEVDYTPGYMEIENAKIGDRNLKFEVDGTILKVNLPKTLKGGEMAELYLEYSAKIPSSIDRFGFHDSGINFGNWYPIVSVYEEDGWRLDPYYDVGEPFFSEVSNYNVEITVPKEVEIATTGKVVSEEIKGGTRTSTIVAKNKRDFAFAASEDFVIGTRQVGDTLIKLYSINDDEEMIDIALDFGEDSIELFSDIYGEYPYDEYKIVNTEFSSGMEYASIVFISNDYFNETWLGFLETVIVHETAHQWWYGIVGTDPVNEAWIDEGLASYSETIYMGEIYGEEEGDIYYKQETKYAYDLNSGLLGDDKRVDKPLSEFEGWNDYGILVYSRGVGFFNAIKDIYGKEVLYEILQSAYDGYKFKTITGEELLSICEQITGDSMEALVKEHLN